jgi:alpha-D-ribose 1-methylphosphonate 5-triphosphate synthase subunit PhnI
MGYIAVRGGAAAIEASMERLRYERLRAGTTLSAEAAAGGLRQLVDQVMAEASLYDRDVAGLAIVQAEGSPEETVFLLRAFRSTLPRLHYSRPVEPDAMRVERRISAAFKDIPGGQILGASADYTHRLIDAGVASETLAQVRAWVAEYLGRSGVDGEIGTLPRVADILRAEGLLPVFPPGTGPVKDITKGSLLFPASRAERLQTLARGLTGALTALGYMALRGYGALHPTVGELRVGGLPVTVPNPDGDPDDPEDAYWIGEVRVTEVETLVPVPVPRGQGRADLRFELGYGISFGQCETRAIAMSLLDHCLETGDRRWPTHDEEFVLLQVDAIEATGFISHLKLPHYVTFQSKLDAVRRARGGEAG